MCDLVPCADPVLWLPCWSVLIPEHVLPLLFCPALLGVALPLSSYFSDVRSSKPSSEPVSSIKPPLSLLGYLLL